MIPENFYSRKFFLTLFVVLLFYRPGHAQKTFPYFGRGIGTPIQENFSLITNGLPRLTVSSGGDVGIGTSIPIYPLTILSDDIGLCHNNGNVYIQTRLVNKLALFGTASPHPLNFMTHNSIVMSIDEFGNAGIGSPPSKNYKLSVEGALGARSIVVKTGSWADFVFEKNYRLKPLSEVENFINANKHLPGVPSEREVKKDGIDVAQMNAILLQKIEELTLYVIEQNKRIEGIERENALLKKK